MNTGEIFEFIEVAKEPYGGEFIPLHRPVFGGNEKQYVSDCIDSNFVSSVGAKVTEFESMVAKFCGVEFGVATVNGTAALHISLVVCGVDKGHEVITQPLTFVATCNAISYVGAHPVFVDVDRDTWACRNHCEAFRVQCVYWMVIGSLLIKIQGDVSPRAYQCTRLGCRVGSMRCEVCSEGVFRWLKTHRIAWKYEESTSLALSEVAAVSFNGNKIITTEGGIILTDDKELATTAKHRQRQPENPRMNFFMMKLAITIMYLISMLP